MPRTDVDRAVREAAASGLDRSSRDDRARWLHRDRRRPRGGPRRARHDRPRETHLSEARLNGEVGRTATQLRFFAGVVREGSYLEATLDCARRLARAAAPRPATHAAGRSASWCVFGGVELPVRVLGARQRHRLRARRRLPGRREGAPRAPGSPVRTVEVARAALAAAGGPESAVALVEGLDAGVALVTHPLVTAVGFTGSTRGGRALFDLAAARPAPIPFYGELGSINPVVVTRAAVAADLDGVAAGLAGSFTATAASTAPSRGSCSCRPARASRTRSRSLDGAAPQRLLTEGIAAAFDRGADALAGRDDVEVVFQGEATDAAAPVVIATSAAAFERAHEAFLEEHFGPLTVLVRYDGDDELARALAGAPGLAHRDDPACTGRGRGGARRGARPHLGAPRLQRLAHGRRDRLGAAPRRIVAGDDRLGAHVGRSDRHPPLAHADRLPGRARGRAAARARRRQPPRRAPP